MTEPSPQKRSLVNIASIVAIATLISKVFGLMRQVVLAAAFGTSAPYGAYQYASIIPSLFLILLGGINGPFHSSLVSVLAKKDNKESATIIQSISTLVGLVMLGVTIVMVVFAPELITLMASGLAQTAEGREVREMAIQQLRIMAPTAWFAGMIGIGFGALNAADVYWLPSVSPLLSSVAMVGGVAGLWAMLGSRLTSPENGALAGMVLAGSFVVGTVLQWGAQAIAQQQQGLGGFKFQLDLKNPAVKKVLRLMGPALFASGMLQINVYTDMQFTSYLPNPSAAVSALDYANLLVQTPLGILSSMILVPFLPIFSKLADPQNWGELKQRIRQGLLITATAMLPLGALMMVLAKPIVQIVYERYAFDPDSSTLVATVLMAYAFGMFVYLGRDVMVRVFYALGDSDTPFKISIVNIGLNALFDYLLLPFGVQGLVLATVSVNVLSLIALTYFLHRKLNGLAWRSWGISIVGLTIASLIAGGISYWILTLMQNSLGSKGFVPLVIELCGAGGAGLLVFGAIASQLRIPEVTMFGERLQAKLKR
ncbi:MAG: murein biosynthesis integral membrane protein MurJ [Cyanobacteria bacterium]|nr:murein biosynthesis integral membrane protein MurJ [Cyanobacteriota bacterium]